jgi:transcriptional regulator with XRE-family HTH domain
MIGDRLIKARERRGWDQKEAAAKLGWASSTLSQYENNRRKPDPPRLKHIADTYNVNAEYLLERTDHPEPIRDDLWELTPEETSVLDGMRDNPDFGVAFSELLAAPERKRKDFLRMWKVYQQMAEHKEDDGMEDE